MLKIYKALLLLLKLIAVSIIQDVSEESVNIFFFLQTLEFSAEFEKMRAVYVFFKLWLH